MPAPTLAEFQARYFPRGGEGVRFLHGLIEAGDRAAPLPDRLDWLIHITRWIRPRGSFASGPASVHAQASNARLRLLVQVLSDVPEWRARAAGVVASIVAETSAYAFLCETGTGRVGFVAEAVDRVTRRLLPASPDPRDLGSTLARMFPTEGDEEWLEGLPSDLVGSLLALIETEAGDLLAALRPALADAAAVVALRASARAFADDMLARSPDQDVGRSPFLRLPQAFDALLAAEDRGAAWADLRQRLGGCRRILAAVHTHLEDRGVSVDLVYRLDLVAKNLDRLTAIAGLLAPAPGGPPGVRAGLDLVAGLLRERRLENSLSGLFHAHTTLLARKIVERTGSTGEHYVTASRTEHRQMLLSAAGGGALTAVCILLKFLTTWAHLPLFFEAVLYSANYGGGFVTMHLLHFTLATKQPSMTAATLAGAIPTGRRDPDLGPLAELVARVGRSQLAAVLGNLGAVVPAALLLDLAVRFTTGQPFLDPAGAESMLHGLHPLFSGTIPFAILTGVLLWTGSVVAGWAENWVVYRRLPAALAGSRTLRRTLGAARAEGLAHALSHNASGIAGNVALGALLGCTPVVGHFFGLPLDVRHVTFSSGGLALAASSLGLTEALAHGLLPALAGIAVVGSLNLAVSFALALLVALRARDVRHEGRIVPAVLARFRSGPRDFFWPPAAPISAAPPA